MKNHIASQALCQELHKLSGWENTAQFWQDDYYHDGSHLWNLYDDSELRSGSVVPAYDLGYLLRKMGPGVQVMRAIDSYTADRLDFDRSYIADTPEDATARLAIELFKAEVLKKVKA